MGPWGLAPPIFFAAAQLPPAAEGGRLLLLDQAKARQAGQARQAQARPSQGWAQQASQPSQSRVGLALPEAEGRLMGQVRHSGLQAIRIFHQILDFFMVFGHFW